MLRSRVALWLGVVVFPPLGAILLWMRGDLGVFRRIAGTLGIVAIAILELYFVYGLRLDFNGNMSELHFRLNQNRRQAARVEESRAQQHPQVAETAPAIVPSTNPTSVPSIGRARAVPVSYWTDFRGPHRDGVYAESPINADWPAAGLPLAWKQPIGAGYASFTTGEGRAYTIEQRRDKEAVTAYDIETGRELWAFTYPASFDEILGGPGPRATPVYRDGLVYSLGAKGDFYCLFAGTGKPKWSTNILKDNGASNKEWAMAGSPLLLEEKVIVTPGGGSGKSMVAYNRLTGNMIWHSLNDRTAYTSPIEATLAGRRQIVWLSAEGVSGIAPEDGRLLWKYPFPASMDMNCAQPIVIDESNVMLSSSDAGGSVLLEISQSDGAFTPREVWKTNRFRNKFNSSVLYQGYVYGFDDGIFACFDPKTGELKWKGGRYGFGQVLLAGGYLVVTTEQGEVVLLKATPEGHQELHRFAAVEGKTWNIPAIDHGMLLVRNATEMAGFRIGRTQE